MPKVSTFYHILNFLGNFCNNGKLSVLKQQHVYLQNKHGKGYPCHFLKIKMQKIILNNSKKILKKENDAPSKTHIM